MGAFWYPTEVCSAVIARASGGENGARRFASTRAGARDNGNFYRLHYATLYMTVSSPSNDAVAALDLQLQWGAAFRVRLRSSAPPHASRDRRHEPMGDAPKGSAALNRSDVVGLSLKCRLTRASFVDFSYMIPMRRIWLDAAPSLNQQGK